MMEHVEHTEKIIEPLNNPHLINLAVNHHETLDGKGYGKGIKGYAMVEDQNLVNASDIVGALLEKREYKDALPYDVTMNILEEEMAKLKVDKKYKKYFENNRETIESASHKSLELFDKIKKSLS
jgi:HD-GYP domain-containing protein (c-di-GMP phosphodiesterase class II)